MSQCAFRTEIKGFSSGYCLVATVKREFAYLCGIALIPESIFKKLNSSEIAQLVSIFYNQKIHGENDLFATFAEIIERSMRGEEKQR